VDRRKDISFEEQTIILAQASHFGVGISRDFLSRQNELCQNKKQLSVDFSAIIAMVISGLTLAENGTRLFLHPIASKTA
jgi:hypothetical protein